VRAWLRVMSAVAVFSVGAIFENYFTVYL